MKKADIQSAGLLMFRPGNTGPEVFLVHPGGPYWSKKNEGSWTVPKGVCEAGEESLAAAQREFHEETGFEAHGPFLALGSVQQKSGKTVMAWAFQGDCDPSLLVSNSCEIEWPPRSKIRLTIPEIDRGAWFSLAEAALFMREEQQAFLHTLAGQLAI